MDRYKYLFKNIGLLTLSNFASKLLSLFLVPLYTNILTSTEYGIYDIFMTSIGILLPILTLNIQESTMRFSMDNNYKREAIVTVTVRCFLFANIIILLGIGVNKIFHLSGIVEEYALFFFLMFLAQSMSGIIVAYIRGIDKITELSVSSVISSFSTICLNILFLVVFKAGLTGYFLANVIGPIIQSVYLVFKAQAFCNIHIKEHCQEEKKAMLTYSKPMIANSIAWWVNNASDRYVVIFFFGLAENGIYSVASKIPSILNIFQSIFNQAWTLSAVRDFDSDDKNGFFSNTYRAYNCMLVILCSVIIAFDKILAKFMYSKEFYVAWRYVPWLTIAIIFGALSGYIGGFFSAVKDSKIFAKSSLIGAVSNIILNFILTPFMGALGAAMATTICYFIVWCFRYCHSKRFIKMNFPIVRDLISYVLLIGQAVSLLIVERESILYVVQAIFLGMIVVCYYKEILSIPNKMEEMLLKKNI